MKKIFLLSVFSLLCSITTFAQFPGLGTVASPSFQCLGDDVELLITEITMNADPAFLQSIASSINDAIPSNLPPVFHLIEMEFGYVSPNFDTRVDFQEIDISIERFDNISIPLIIAFKEGFYSGLKVEGRYDINGAFEGFTLRNIGNYNGGGIATVAAVASRITTGDMSGPQLSRLEITRENKIVQYKKANRSCTAPNTSTSLHYYFQLQGKEIQSNPGLASINVYPNPAKSTLFAETTDGSSIEEIILSNLFGQNMNHKVSTRYGLNEAQINTNHLETGIYLLQLKTSTGSTIIKKVAIRQD